MAAKDSYDVLRLIGHGRSSYVSSENVTGTPLIYWLKYHPHLTKTMLFRWMKVLAEQLDRFHKCRGQPCYQYVNPYSIVVTEEGDLYFLDVGAESNEEMLRKMQQRSVREYFLPREEAYYQKASVQLDIYGLGRTYQYLLSETEQEPALTKREIVKLQKIISKCLNRQSKQAFQKVSDIQKCIPECRESEEKKKRKVILPAAAVFVMVVLVFFVPREREPKEKKPEIGKEREPQREQQLELELALLYFLEAQDYEESIRHLQNVKGDLVSEALIVIARSLGGGMVQDSKFREALQKLEKEMAKKDLSEREECAYYECLLKGYARLTTEEDMEELLRLGDTYEQLVEEVTPELTAVMAKACEKCGRFAEALERYEELMESTQDADERESLYEKQAQVALAGDMPEKSLEILREGIKEFESSANLRIAYIKMQCEDPAINRAVCVKAIEEALKAVPEISEDAQFQKLMREYGFQVEGEKVWEEK